MVRLTVKRSDIRKIEIKELMELTHVELAHLVLLVSSPASDEIKFDCDVCSDALQQLDVPVEGKAKVSGDEK